MSLWNRPYWTASLILLSVNSKTKAIKGTISKLEREMTNLRLKIHEEEIALRKTWRPRHEDSVRIVRQTHLQSLSSALYIKLPRELRDMIYSFCLNDDWDDQVLADSMEILSGFSYLSQSRNHDRLCKYILLDPAFVQKEVAIEIAQMIYARTEVPSFGMDRRKGKSRILLLQGFLKRDFFNLGMYHLPVTC